MKRFEDGAALPLALGQQAPLTTRRCFLEVLSMGTATVAFAGCSGGSGEAEAFGDVSAGAVSSLEVGMVKSVSGAPAIIGRDAGGVYAMTSTCTHMGCTVAPSTGLSSTVLLCPCHGSTFDKNGAVLRPPATKPLVHYAVEIDSSGNIIVHGGTQVSAATRVAVT